MPAPRGRIHVPTVPSHVHTRTAYADGGPAGRPLQPGGPGSGRAGERPDRHSVQPFSPVAASTAQAFASVAAATGTIIV
ncbi:hypothetical protein GCM10018777_26840 [Streptomyces albogriseolus]|nr:hypothetical protein GCM10018777_26840 [Streptomyces viridodiastaticus]